MHCLPDYSSSSLRVPAQWNHSDALTFGLIGPGSLLKNKIKQSWPLEDAHQTKTSAVCSKRS